MLESSLSILSTHTVAPGGSSDVYEGSLGGLRVCVNGPRIYTKEESWTAEKVRYRLSLLALLTRPRTFHRKVVTGRRFTHPNIIPLPGLTLELL